jgi:hypothetical protein
MKSTKELLRQIHDPNLSVTERAVLCCRLAKHLEEIGNYEAGCEALDDRRDGDDADRKHLSLQEAIEKTALAGFESSAHSDA